jgi:hypothetical protein
LVPVIMQDRRMYRLAAPAAIPPVTRRAPDAQWRPARGRSIRHCQWRDCNRYLQTQRAARGESGPQRRYHILPGKAVGPRIVYGLHECLVENIGVQVDPETLRAALACQEGHCRGHRIPFRMLTEQIGD